MVIINSQTIRIYPSKDYTVAISELEINVWSYNVISCFHTRMQQQNSRENKLAHEEKCKKALPCFHLHQLHAKGWRIQMECLQYIVPEHHHKMIEHLYLKCPYVKYVLLQQLETKCLMFKHGSVLHMIFSINK